MQPTRNENPVFKTSWVHIIRSKLLTKEVGLRVYCCCFVHALTIDIKSSFDWNTTKVQLAVALQQYGQEIDYFKAVFNRDKTEILVSVLF